MSKGKIIDHELVRQLAIILNETDLTEIELEQEDMRIRVARNVIVAAAPIAAAPVAAVAAAPVAAAPQAAEPKAESNEANTVTSPMVGTAYHSPEPGAKSYVQIGDKISVGQTIIIIEAMKHMNQIAAERAGTVTEIFVENGQPVEYGEPLMVIE
ncbi:MAG: acetyl-CoA carboxylase biotin carboxyl carrier protein [Rhizobiales bacterium]|nr:acetyl-CoA carboxylase biotin carboxyl carrier protein [Hyphomicrobiales bacterium]